MSVLVRSILILLILLSSSPSWAARLAGTVMIQKGAVSALSGRGEEEEVRRGIRSLRVDLGERLRTSPLVEASFLGHDETMVPLEGGAIYRVERDGLWLVREDARIRVLEFLRPPGQSWNKNSPDGTKSLANLRTTGAPRVRSGRDFKPHLVDGDISLTTNSSLALGLDDRALLAMIDGGRVLLDGSSRLMVQRRALVMTEGVLFGRAGGPARVILTPTLSVAAAQGSLFQVTTESDGSSRVLCLQGRLVVAPAAGSRGATHRLSPGEVFQRGVTGDSQERPRRVLNDQYLERATQGLTESLEGADPLRATRLAREATQLPSTTQTSPERSPRTPAPPPANERSIPPSFYQAPAEGMGEDDADRAVARSLKEEAETSFGSEWQARDRRAPRRAPSVRNEVPRSVAPSNLPPGLVSSSSHSMMSAQHPLWSSSFGVTTPAVPAAR